MNTIDKLWHSTQQKEWDNGLVRYWDRVAPANLELEQSLEALGHERIRQMSAEEWYDFLRCEYFRWKFTQANIYRANVGHLQRHYENSPDELLDTKNKLLDFEYSDLRAGIIIGRKISGLATAGATGLLSLLYPSVFATVDQFVVKALCDVSNLSESAAIARMKPADEGKQISLSINNGILLIEIMQRKAAELNKLFKTTSWTPRKIDMVLWGYRE